MENILSAKILTNRTFFLHGSRAGIQNLVGAVSAETKMPTRHQGYLPRSIEANNASIRIQTRWSVFRVFSARTKLGEQLTKSLLAFMLEIKARWVFMVTIA